MVTLSQNLTETAYDLVGIGFGPSNLTLAVAIDERNRWAGCRPVRSRFFEKQPSFGWHRGMLLDDATMQVSFLKDLVTMRDPASDFSFLCYLKQRHRLVDFISHKTLFPLRVEFHGYFEWAAARLADQVTYGAEVISVRPVECNGAVVWFDVIASMSDDPRRLVVCRARNVVVAAGQSGAEVVAHLHNRLPQTEMYAVFARYCYAPAADSPFANRIFDPAVVDHYFDAPTDVQRILFDYHRNTNYDILRLLGEAGSLCERAPEGRLVVLRDYRVRTAPHVSAGIYLRGGTEHSHGITASLQSDTAIRAGEILASILTDSAATDLPTPAFAATTQRC